MGQQSRICFRCGHETTEAAGKCPKCGGRLRTTREVRGLGVVQLLIGLFLVGLMGTITYRLAPSLLDAGSPAGGARFTGTRDQALLILALFGLVITFGLGSVASGLWQIKTGRRNRWLFIAMLALFVLVILVAWFTRVRLGG